MRRIPEFDALRGVAAFVIVLFHLRFSGKFPVLGTAVDLFFVLSGYLITTILLRSRHCEGYFRVFYARRALRIWPIYYLAFPAFFLLVNPSLPRPHAGDALPYFLTYTQFLQGYWGGAMPPMSPDFAHTWTLAVEEQFYLIWPLLIWLVGRKGLPFLAVPLWVMPPILRSCGVFGHLLVTRCDGLALGAILAWLLFDGSLLVRRRSAFGLGFAAAMVAGLAYPLWSPPVLSALHRLRPDWTWHMIEHSLNYSRMSVAYFGLVGLVVCYAGRPWLGILRLRSLAFAGQISYGLYLYHPMVFRAVGLIGLRLGFRGSAMMDAVRVVACLAVASLSWRYVERPFLKLKDRFPYREPRSAPAGPHHLGVAVATSRPARW